MLSLLFLSPETTQRSCPTRLHKGFGSRHQKTLGLGQLGHIDRLVRSVVRGSGLIFCEINQKYLQQYQVQVAPGHPPTWSINFAVSFTARLVSTAAFINSRCVFENNQSQASGAAPLSCLWGKKEKCVGTGMVSFIVADLTCLDGSESIQKWISNQTTSEVYLYKRAGSPWAAISSPTVMWRSMEIRGDLHKVFSNF